jgi:Ca2+-binding RTX toxin-like protein
MKRLTIVLAVVGMMLLLSAGVAFALTVDCTAIRACIGTDDDDTLNGSSGVDYMQGRQGSDELFANDGEYASMEGDAFDPANNDTSTDGDDLLMGGDGWDEMAGYGGADTYSGGRRGDYIFAEESSVNMGDDILHSGRGSDWIQAKDETKDTIGCGPGKYDVVFFDEGIDEINSITCEYMNPDFGGGIAVASSSKAVKMGAEKVNALRARN